MLWWVLDPPSRKRRPRRVPGEGAGVKELPDKPQVWGDPCLCPVPRDVGSVAEYSASL